MHHDDWGGRVVRGGGIAFLGDQPVARRSCCLGVGPDLRDGVRADDDLAARVAYSTAAWTGGMETKGILLALGRSVYGVTAHLSIGFVWCDCAVRARGISAAPRWICMAGL